MYQAKTRGIQITVEPEFLHEESAPERALFVWSYRVEIENISQVSIKVLTRHWLITDAFGRTEEVIGEGVVGRQPVIAPGERFTYTSGAPLTTPSGFMRGSYGVETGSGEAFDVEIPAFSLDSPHATQRVH